MNLISAFGAYCFFDNEPKALQGYCIEDTKQLSRFPAQPFIPVFVLKSLAKENGVQFPKCSLSIVSFW